jgi:hypothetical protein
MGHRMADSEEVFISYSHDSPEHIAAVLALSNRLRSDGVDCVLDQYETSPPEGWPRWMDRRIRDAKYVIAICTETYYRRVMGEETAGVGNGVRWEGNLVYQHFYDSGSESAKFVPVVFRTQQTKFVPTPLKGATIYALDRDNGYNDLYARLTNTAPATKPPLGKRKALPAKPVKTNPALYVTGPIDVDLWNAAQWKATFFIWGGDAPPGLGLAFRNEEAARKIFGAWHERFGRRDPEEELRISIIEGDIPGKERGYSVHIGTDFEVFTRRLRDAGYEYGDNDHLFMVSRFHRMNPPPHSPNLAQFKLAYRQHKTYYLLPGVYKSDSDVRPLTDLSILKSKLFLRRVSDIGLNDVDSAVLGTEGD